MKHAAVSLALWAAFVTPLAAVDPTLPDCRGSSDAALAWKPTSDIAERGGLVVLAPGSAGDVPRSAPVEILPLADARGQREFIGFSERKDCTWYARTPDDIATWCTDWVRPVMRELGLNLVETAGAVKLSGKVLSFFVIEDSLYRAEVKLRIDAASSDGASLWSGVVTGTCARFGRNHKLDNYHEALSDALIDAAQRLAKDPSFRQAVAWR